MIKSVVKNFHGDAADLKLPETADDCSVPLNGWCNGYK